MLIRRVEGLIKGKSRFLLVPLLLILLKVLGSVFIYSSTGLDTGDSYWMNPDKIPIVRQNEILLENVNRTHSYFYTFVGWDSAWYLSIAFKGYGFYEQSFAFRPLLPYLSRCMNYLFSNQVLSIVMVTLLSGILWIPFFQKISEMYMSRLSSIFITLIFSVSPYNLIFTTVAYSEGIFLLFTLGAFYYFKKEKYYLAAIFSFLSTLTRPPGVLIAGLMLLEGLKDLDTIKFRKIITSFSPILTSFLWSLYGFFSVDRFNQWIYVSEWNSFYTLLDYLGQIIPRYGLESLKFPHESLNTITILPIFIWISLFSPLYPIYKMFYSNKPIFFYSVFYFLGVILFGTVFSYPRFMTFMFTIWLSLDFEKVMERKYFSAFLFLYTLLSFSLSIYLWRGFVIGLFIS
ncbi:hypothetical protein GF319_13020 [Candidatus Bathyarchaeota archaeon]|nr:hypothetical protein [Candidatus Bathyarchaeota archaeon]